MAELTACSREWATRSDDERFLSLTDMLGMFMNQRRITRENEVDFKALQVAVDPNDHKGLVIRSNRAAVNGKAAPDFHPTNWSFGQLTSMVKAPAAYIKSLPAPVAAQCLNAGIQEIASQGRMGKVLWSKAQGAQANPQIRALNSDSYGRVYSADVVSQLVERFGDGRTGDFRVPGEFGRQVHIGKHNTTLYASDRDMFVFLADETNRVDIKGRRNGQSGSLARGFFVWNSDVGARSLGIATFLFDYACSNRIVWGAKQYKEVRLRHRGEVQERFLNASAPLFHQLANESAKPIENMIREAQAKQIGTTKEEVATFLERFFTRPQAEKIQLAHMREEDRPIRTIWDATTGATAWAKTIPYQDDRVAVEAKAGKILDLVAESV